MRTYILKRLLLMIPTLFGISFVLWLIVTAAPGDPGQAAAGEAQTQQRGGGESRRIFRAQFNLDKPLFWNSYVSLEPAEVFATVLAAIDRSRPPRERARANERLQDWGYYAVPALIASLDLAKDPMERLAVLWRLSSNGKRIGATRVGRLLSEEEKALNREVYVENEEIQKSLMPDEKVVADGGDAALDHVEQRTGAWKAWYEKRKARWEWSGWEQFRRRLLDTQFATYWGNLLRLDLGDSHVHRLPVFRLILARLPISITLAISSLIIAYLVSIPLGIWSAVGHRTRREQGFSAFLLMLYSLPAFFTATMLLRYFAIGQPFKVIPVAGFESPDTFPLTTWQHIGDVLHHVVAPLVCMTYASFAVLSRYAKSGVLNVIRSDYIRTARAKGLPERVVILKHAVRNGIIPILTLLGTVLPALVGGSVIIETVFQIPGMGFLIFEAITQRDYNVVIGETMIVAVLTMVGILVSDILYAVVDPRISYS